MKKIKLLIFYPSHVFTMNLRASINFIFIIEVWLRMKYLILYAFTRKMLHYLGSIFGEWMHRPNLALIFAFSIIPMSIAGSCGIILRRSRTWKLKKKF